MKKLIAAIAAVLALLAAANSASATTDAEVLDSCKPHDWLRFSAAFEANDMAAMQEMMNDPEMSYCPEIVSTARLLACAADPLSCVEPAAGPEIPPPPSIDIDCPTWNSRCTEPLPPPGAHIGIECSRSEGNGGGGGGEGGGSAGAAPSAPSAPSAPAGVAPRS